MADDQPPDPSSPWAVPGEGPAQTPPDPDEAPPTPPEREPQEGEPGYWGKLPASGRRDATTPRPTWGPPPRTSSTGWTPPPGPPPGSPPGPPPSGWSAPPGAAPGAPAGWPDQAPARTEGLAIAALVLGIVSIILCPIITAIVGLVLAARAIHRIDESGGRLGGRGLATAGRVLSIVGLVIWTIFIAAVAVTAVVQRDNKRLDQLAVGDCFNVPNRLRVNAVKGRSCSSTHDGEVVSVVPFPAGIDEPYPGVRPLAEFAQSRCPAEFAGYVGRDPNASRFAVIWLYPLEDTWKRRHVRVVVCAALDPNGRHLTTSVRGINQ